VARKSNHTFTAFYISLYPLLIFILNRGNQDYVAYLDIFSSNEKYAEIGYQILIAFVKLLGGSHNSIIMVLGVTLFFTLLKLSSKIRYAAVVPVIYLIFPSIIDLVQVRNSFSFYFFVISFLYYIDRRMFLCFLFSLLSISFHYFGFLFSLTILAMHFFGRLNNYKIYILMILNFVVILFFLPIAVSFINPYVGYKLSHYISYDYKYHSILIWGGVSITISLIYVYLFNRHNAINNDNVGYGFFRLNRIVVLFVPILMILDESNRYFRGVIFLQLISLMYLLPYFNKKVRLFLVVFSFSIVITFAFIYYYLLNVDSIVFSIL
jgi:hypothetical protein